MSPPPPSVPPSPPFPPSPPLEPPSVPPVVLLANVTAALSTQASGSIWAFVAAAPLGILALFAASWYLKKQLGSSAPGVGPRSKVALVEDVALASTPATPTKSLMLVPAWPGTPAPVPSADQVMPSPQQMMAWGGEPHAEQMPYPPMPPPMPPQLPPPMPYSEPPPYSAQMPYTEQMPPPPMPPPMMPYSEQPYAYPEQPYSEQIPPDSETMPPFPEPMPPPPRYEAPTPTSPRSLNFYVHTDTPQQQTPQSLPPPPPPFPAASPPPMELKDAFEQADVNHDGKLSRAEFANFLKMSGMNVADRGPPQQAQGDAFWGVAP